MGKKTALDTQTVTAMSLDQLTAAAKDAYKRKDIVAMECIRDHALTCKNRRRALGRVLKVHLDDGTAPDWAWAAMPAKARWAAMEAAKKAAEKPKAPAKSPAKGRKPKAAPEADQLEAQTALAHSLGVDLGKLQALIALAKS